MVLSNDIRRALHRFDEQHGTALAQQTTVMATNDISLAFLKSLGALEHSIDVFGIGTSLSNFKDIKPIGLVFKLVEEDGTPRLKLTGCGLEKASLPYEKTVLRFVDAEGDSGFLVVAKNETVGTGPFNGFSKHPATLDYHQATVNVMQPGTVYGDRLNQIDFRATKIFKLQKGQLEANFDVYNLGNSDAILTQINTFGATWTRPTAVIQPRFVKFTVRYDF